MTKRHTTGTARRGPNLHPYPGARHRSAARVPPPRGPRAAASVVAALAVCAGAAGCIEFRRGESKTVDDVIDTKTDVVRDVASDDGEMDLRGTVLVVSVTPGCNLVETETVEHETSYERKWDEEETVLPVAMLEVLSLAPMIAGVALLADSPQVYESDPNSRLYNPTGHKTAVNAGAALLAVGAVVNIWPTVELIRSAIPETDTSTSTRTGQILQRDVECSADVNAAGRYVTLRWSGGTYSLGSTDGAGRLSSDLKQVLPLSVFQSPTPPVSMGVWLDSQYLGDVGVASVGIALLAEREEQDDLAWRAAEAGACAANRNEQACAGVRRYVGSFPQGRHAAEANALLASLQPAVVPQPPPPGGPVIATDPASERMDRAVSEAQEAAQTAMENVWKKFEADTKKNEERADKEAKQAGHTACVQTCRKVCAQDKPCRSGCEEQCP